MVFICMQRVCLRARASQWAKPRAKGRNECESISVARALLQISALAHAREPDTKHDNQPARKHRKWKSGCWCRRARGWQRRAPPHPSGPIKIRGTLRSSFAGALHNNPCAGWQQTICISSPTHRNNFAVIMKRKADKGPNLLANGTIRHSQNKAGEICSNYCLSLGGWRISNQKDIQRENSPIGYCRL